MIKKDKSLVPGIGVSGMVMCPLFKGACLKSGCELWVELNYGKHKVARCSLSWLAILNVETRQSIDRLKELKWHQSQKDIPLEPRNK